MSPKTLIFSALCAILLSTLVSAATSRPKGYQGCYGDGRKRALSVWTKDVDSITECIDICKEKKLPYAGLEYYTQCYCGGDFHRYGKSDACDLKCKKGGGICGGHWALSVYLVSDKFLPNKKSYVGCYKDASVGRSMEWGGEVDDVSSCIKMCKDKGTKYARLQYYDQCRCGDSYSKWGKSKEYDCRYPCKNGGICGGDYANSVYRTYSITKYIK